jgi:hypothetical protein
MRILPLFPPPCSKLMQRDRPLSDYFACDQNLIPRSPRLSFRNILDSECNRRFSI